MISADADGSLRLQMSVSRQIGYQIVHTNRPVFDLDEPTLARIVDHRPVLLIVDGVIKARYGERLHAYASEHLDLAGTVIVQGDESHKTWEQAAAICNAAIECKLGRHAIMVGIGGGVTLDVAGFAASIYRRGIAYLRIPTTLIGQVDVSVGIKQGINAGGQKNILGSFFPPVASINDVSFLHSLPLVHLAAGLAEIIKIALIRDSPLFELVETHAEALLTSHFAGPETSARLIMERAERGMLHELRDNLFETDLKRAVDFGHTFSPAMETASRYGLSHGYAVALDMLISTQLAVQGGLCAPGVLHRLLGMYRVIGLPTTQNFCNAGMLHRSLDSVRAHRGGALNLVVPTAVGSSTFLQEVSLDDLQTALNGLSQRSESHADAAV